MSDSINELHSHVKMPLEVLREMLEEEPNHEYVIERALIYKKRNKMPTKEELIGLISKIRDGDGSDAEVDEWLRIVEDNVPDPDVSDLIFSSETEEMTEEEIFDRALSYRPIILYP